MTLHMRDMENQEIGRAEGIVEGMVSAFREMEVMDEIILKKIMEKFNMTEEEAGKYL